MASEMQDLFDKNLEKDVPLAERIRPKSFREFVGQEKIVGEGRLLMKELSFGSGYEYNPNYDEPVKQDYLPEKLKGRKYLKGK